MPDVEVDEPAEGKIVECGPKCENDLAPGTHVGFNKWAGQFKWYKGVEYQILRDEEIDYVVMAEEVK